MPGPMFVVQPQEPIVIKMLGACSNSFCRATFKDTRRSDHVAWQDDLEDELNLRVDEFLYVISSFVNFLMRG